MQTPPFKSNRSKLIVSIRGVYNNWRRRHNCAGSQSFKWQYAKCSIWLPLDNMAMTSASSPFILAANQRSWKWRQGGRLIGCLSGLGTQRSGSYSRDPGIFLWRVSRSTFCPPPRSGHASLGWGRILYKCSTLGDGSDRLWSSRPECWKRKEI